MNKEIKLSNLQNRLLYNFIVKERNQLIHPDIDSIKEINNNLSIEIKLKPSYVNLNNFGGDIKKYKKELDKLVKKLN